METRRHCSINRSNRRSHTRAAKVVWFSALNFKINMWLIKHLNDYIQLAASWRRRRRPNETGSLLFRTMHAWRFRVTNWVELHLFINTINKQFWEHQGFGGDRENQIEAVTLWSSTTPWDRVGSGSSPCGRGSVNILYIIVFSLSLYSTQHTPTRYTQQVECKKALINESSCVTEMSWSPTSG